MSNDSPTVASDPVDRSDGNPSIPPRADWRQSPVVRLLLILLIPASAWGSYRGWNWSKTRHFRKSCELAKQSDDWRTLRQVAEDWGTWDPVAGRAWWYASEAAQELDDMEGLAASLAKVPASDPKYLFALVEKANLEWTTLNRPLSALETSQQVLKIDGRVTEIQSRVISFYAMTLQRASMLRAIRASMDVGAEPRESYPYLVMADILTFSNGAKLTNRWMASAPEDLRIKIGFAVHTAMSYALSADAGASTEAIEMNAEAMRQLEGFLERTPHDPVLLTYLLHRAYQAGDVERVGTLLQNVDEEGIDDHMVWVFRGWYHFAVDEFDAAEEAITEALRLHPMSHLAHHEYAKLLRKREQPDAEVESHQRLAATGKELRTLVLQLGSAIEAPPALLEQIRNYAAECGDTQVATALTRRLSPPPGMGPFGY